MIQLTDKFRIVTHKLPQEVLAAIWRLVLILVLGLLHLLKFIWERIRFKKKCGTKEWPRNPNCCKVPEQVKRKPDPCIYSQIYRMSQGLSVTWNNPDIVIEQPGVGVVLSSELQANTDYIVRAKISNSAADPALATEVRCFYRPWSFNSPDITPIEVNANGTEKVEIVHILPWGSEIASFKWHTPAEAGHYCIRVECRHPDDKNPNNNIGQENTNVISAKAGETVEVSPMLFNQTDRKQQIRIFADQFNIPEGEIDLTLKKKHFPLRKTHLFDGLHRAMLVTDTRTAKLRLQANSVPFITRYAYTGWDKLKTSMQRGQHPIDKVEDLRVNGLVLDDGWATIAIADGDNKAVPLKFTIPTTAISNESFLLNFTATNQVGKVVGGITLKINVV